jgi:hypothetical protein
MLGHQTVKTFSIEAQINKQTVNLFGIPTEGQLTDETFSCSQNKKKKKVKLLTFHTGRAHFI